MDVIFIQRLWMLRWAVDADHATSSADAEHFTASSAGVQTLRASQHAVATADPIVIFNLSVILLTYFGIYFALAVVRTKNFYIYGHGISSRLEQILEDTTTYCVHVAPMLSVLFFEVAKRADLIAGGVLSPWACWSVCIGSLAFAVQAFFCVLSQWMMPKAETDVTSGRSSLGAVRFCCQLCNLATLLVYGSVLVIMVATMLTMGNSKVPVGHFCTLVLTLTYMVVYLALFLVRTYRGTSFYVEVFKRAAISINFAPMLAIFFMGTQTVVDLGGSTVPVGTEEWMIFATFSVVFMVFMVIIAPICDGTKWEDAGSRGAHNPVFFIFTALGVAAMVVVYIGLYVIAKELWSEDVKADQKVLAYALFDFACLYFGIYLAFWLLVVTDRYFGRILTALKMAKDTVAFCPMFSVLFVTAFFGAFPLVPQSRSQDFMLVCVTAMCIQVAMVVFSGFLGKNAPGIQLMTLVFYVALVVVHLSVLVVIYGLVTISADNASASGAWFA